MNCRFCKSLLDNICCRNCELSNDLISCLSGAKEYYLLRFSIDNIMYVVQSIYFLGKSYLFQIIESDEKIIFTTNQSDFFTPGNVIKKTKMINVFK